jgi:hypothetical protein
MTPLEASTSLICEILHCTPLPELQSQRRHVRWQNPPCHWAARGLTMDGKSHFPALRCSAQVKLSPVGFIDAGVMEGDLAVGLAAIHDGHYLHTFGGIDGGAVAQVGWG